MSDIEFYESNVRKLGVDFYEFTERVSIILENENEFSDFNDNVKQSVLKQLQKEQLLRLTKKLL